jgi:MraZ protein
LGVAIVDLFIGNALNAVDAKGRVSLPAGFRAVVEDRQRRMAPEGGASEPLKQVTFVYNPERGCLLGFDTSVANMIVAARDAQGDAADQGDIFSIQKKDRGALKGAWTVSYDPGGRMVLPDYLREKAGIGDLAFFHGIQRMFELWNPEAYLAHQDSDDVEDQDQLAHMLRKARSKND